MQDIQVSSGPEILSSGQDRAQVNRCPAVPGQFRTAGSEFRTGQDSQPLPAVQDTGQAGQDIIPEVSIGPCFESILLPVAKPRYHYPHISLPDKRYGTAHILRDGVGGSTMHQSETEILSWCIFTLLHIHTAQRVLLRFHNPRLLATRFDHARSTGHTVEVIACSHDVLPNSSNANRI